jgi:hypothetical protein
MHRHFIVDRYIELLEQSDVFGALGLRNLKVLAHQELSSSSSPAIFAVMIWPIESVARWLQLLQNVATPPTFTPFAALCKQNKTVQDQT